MLDRLRPDLAAIVVWVGSRISVFIAATYATWILAGSVTVFSGFPDQEVPPLGPVATWNQWDLAWYASIASGGYGAPGWEANYAFMPGYPALLWVMGKVPLLNLHATIAGLAISAIAGLVAAVALSRLTRDVSGRGEIGVLAWVLAPMAVYLAAPYTEALFCAFAFSAWLAGRRGHWWLAGVLASGATLVRVNGLFLAVGLIVMFAIRHPRPWRQSPALLLPFAAFAAVISWFTVRTGSWTTWLDAQSAGWGRHFSWPWTTWRETYHLAFDARVTATFSLQYRIELVAVLVLIALVAVLLMRKWWAEAVYVLLTLAALATSTVYYSVPRSLLVAFPLWMLLGVWMSARRWALAAYVACATPLMLMGVMAFVNGRWVA